jgi:hypothetical protein
VIEADFETRSAVDLRKHGPYVYFEHPSARVLLGSFKLGEDRFRWRYGEPCPEPLRAHIEAGGQIAAHNAAFEALCFDWLADHCGWPRPALGQFRCTAATAAAMQLPRALEKLSDALGLPVEKDKEGKRLIRKFSLPGKGGGFVEPEDDPEDFDRFHDYCDMDVEVEAAADARMVPLSDAEQAVYTLSERINRRGIRIDVDSARAALVLADRAKAALDVQMRETTAGAVRKCSEVARLTAWVAEQGVEVASLAKADLDDVLAKPDLPSHVRAALETRREAAKTSTSKIKAMLDRANADGRVRGTYMYHGAGTGRWTSMGVNFANMPRSRKAFEGVRQDVLFEAIRHGDPEYLQALYGPELGRPLHLLSDAIRGFIWAAPDHDLIQADYSNIEGVMVAWLAGEEWKLEAFREIFADPDAHPDLYRRTAAGILGLPLEEVTKKHWARQAVGKPAELACFAPDTQVLTDHGVKTIVEVLDTDKLWDGEEWVKHRGVVERPARRVADVDGIGVTPDHLIMTGQKWTPARKLASSPSILASALATGSESLRSLASAKGPQAGCTPSSCGAPAAPSPTRSRRRTCAAALQRAAIGARKLLPGSGERDISATPISCPTRAIAPDFSTASRLATAGVSTRATGGSRTTAGEGSPSRGAATAGGSWRISSRWTAGTTRISNSIASTWMAITRRETCGSSLARRTRGTSAASATCSAASRASNGKTPYFGPVFDIAYAGPRNRFTVLSDSGALVVHNCGYQGGVSAFYTFARNGGVDMAGIAPPVLEGADPEALEKARRRYANNWKRNQARARELPEDAWVACEIIKNGWRAQNPAIAKSWHDLEAAARSAVQEPGTVREAARVRYCVRFGYLWALLPSGRCLCYGAPRLKDQVWAKVLLEDGSWSDAEVMDRDAAERAELAGKVRIQGETSAKVTVMGTDSATKRWRRYALYGGLLCENNTQASARDILVNGMQNVEAAGYPVVAHVYDEVIAEIPRGFGSQDEFNALLCRLPAWAGGLPIAADGWRGKRYRKD